MRRAAKVDRNQAEIVEALRNAGASVYCTHAVGQGFPDLCVGYYGHTVLVECKDGTKPPSACKLTPAQESFFESFDGNAIVVFSPEDALDKLEKAVFAWNQKPTL